MKKQFLGYEADQHHLKLSSKGDWTLDSVRRIEQELRTVPCDKKIVWDVSEVSEFDSAGILLFSEYLERFQEETSLEVVGYSENQKEMYRLLRTSTQEIEVLRKRSILERLGRKTFEIYTDIKEFITFIGHLFYTMFHIVIKPQNIRFKEMIMLLEPNAGEISVLGKEYQ